MQAGGAARAAADVPRRQLLGQLVAKILVSALLFRRRRCLLLASDASNIAQLVGCRCCCRCPGHKLALAAAHAGLAGRKKLLCVAHCLQV